jgi:2-oxo-4-hydroxy-4-carboxy-5-ureidoimidazoline decarboxylase
MTLLDNWNALAAEEAIEPILACCGSHAFASALISARPFASLDDLLRTADSIWWSLRKEDWLEAFACHPRIGESRPAASYQFAAWSKEEQSKASTAPTSVVASIADKNNEYEARHGFIYIVCASGKSADELLAILDRRIDNPTAVEIEEAAEQQRQITHLRLRKWLIS